MRRAAMVTIAVLVGLLTGCTGGPGSESGALTVVASPSLTDVIGGVARAFMSSHPGVRVDTVFAPDSSLADGSAAPHPDLIVAEDPQTLVAAGVTAPPPPFAEGQLVLAVARADIGTVNGLDDLARPDVRVALCAPTEPCGRVAEAVLAAAQLTLGGNAVYDSDVRSVLRRLTDGSADAALVYRSDAIGAGDQVIAIELPTAGAAVARFVAGIAPAAPNPAVAQLFLDYLTSAPVRADLVSDGFSPPK